MAIEQIKAAAAQPSLIYQPVSYVERLDLVQVFLQGQPLEVELGCGDGSFLVEWARQNPARNFLGVERLKGRLRKLDRKGRRAGLVNLRGLRLEAAYTVEYLLPRASVAAFHIYFPDPWPKRKHWKHRLINGHFAEIAACALVPGGMVCLRTDDAAYFEQIQTVFGANPRFRPVATPATLSAVVTDFERDFQARGLETLRAAYQRD